MDTSQPAEAISEPSEATPQQAEAEIEEKETDNQSKETKEEYDYTQQAKIMDALTSVTEPIIGLDYIVEVQYPDTDIHPSYSCLLCKCTIGVIAVIEHVTSTKHRMNFVEQNDPEGRIILESMQSSGIPLDGLTEERASTLEKNLGRGTVKVKLEKSKFGAIVGMRKRPKPSFSADHIAQKRTNFDYSYFPSSSSSFDYNEQQKNFLAHLPYFDIETKLQILEELSTVEIIDDYMARDAMTMITSLYTLLKKFKTAYIQQTAIARPSRDIRSIPISYPVAGNRAPPPPRPYGPRNFM